MLERPHLEDRPSLEMEPAPSPKLSLLDITQDVRRIIYHHLFTRARILLPASRRRVRARHLNLPILRTCRKIRDEALPCLYSAIVLISIPPYNRTTEPLTTPTAYLSAVQSMLLTNFHLACSFPGAMNFRIDPLSQCPALRTLIVENTVAFPVSCPLEEMQEASPCSTPSPAGKAAPKLAERIRRKLTSYDGVLGRIYLAPERTFEIILKLHIDAWTEERGIRVADIEWCVKAVTCSQLASR